MEKRFPQILLVGNGINIAFGDDDWNEFLVSIACNSNIPENKKKKLESPMPLKAVLLAGDRLGEKLETESKNKYGNVDNPEKKALVQNLLTAGFDRILTTNYSYEFELAALDNIGLNDYRLIKMSSHTDAVNRVEGKYLLHSFNEVLFKNIRNEIWHIHGEARKPQSMVLGHYYYAQLLGKMQKELDGYKEIMKKWELSGLDKCNSWVESFIMGDVHVLGFGFDMSEFDLWWLINRKKREKYLHGKLYYYCPEPAEFSEKIELLRIYGAEFKSYGYKLTGDKETDKKIKTEFIKTAVSEITNNRGE